MLLAAEDHLYLVLAMRLERVRPVLHPVVRERLEMPPTSVRIGLGSVLDLGPDSVQLRLWGFESGAHIVVA